ncbi:MAG: HEAT repeat domain-containing protein [Hydrococcus sp. SU_1_0]|nr:HEAT repeat domain-containing protein [Hydrococcus sp. SU_1_0]
MICNRFTFIIIYFALAGFSPSYSWAAKPNLLSPNAINGQTINDAVSSSRQELIDPTFQKAPKQKAIAQASSSNPEPPQKINRLWFFGGMAITSSIALFLTWILFSKPQEREEDLASELTAIPTVNQQPPLNKAKLRIRKPLVQSKISQIDSPISPIADIDADIDVVQELINDLQHPHNYPNSYSEGKTFSVSSSPHISIRRKAIEKLAKVGDYRSIEPLLKIMPQVGTLDKSLILKAVTQINQRTFQPINSELFVALQNEHPEVRLNALRDLKGLYQFVSPVITQIAQMQSDQDYEVRQTATQVLRQLNASPLPTFNNSSEDEVDDLIVGKESETNLHLVAYLLAELDAER